MAALLEWCIRHEVARTADVLLAGGQRETQAHMLQATVDLIRCM